MNIRKEGFLQKNEELLQELEKLNRKEEGVFFDGAFDPNEYYNSSPKILWILKEAYGDPISYPKYFNEEYDKFYQNLILGVSRNTWGPICNVSDCILNEFREYDASIPDLNQKEQFNKSLHKFALININKDSSDTGGRSVTRNIEKAKEYYDDFLFRQIEHLDPDIIICGNTFQFLREHYNYPEVIKKSEGIDYVDHYWIGDKLFLDPYHPGYTAYGKIDAAMYINDIVRTVRDCYIRKKL